MKKDDLKDDKPMTADTKESVELELTRAIRSFRVRTSVRAGEELGPGPSPRPITTKH
jgi:hypothetical protein